MEPRKTIVHAEPERMSGPALEALLVSGALTGGWVLDPRTSSVRLKTRSLGIRVSGTFREVSGHGTVSPQGEVSGGITVSAASIDTKNTRRDKHLRSAEIFDVANTPDIAFALDGIRPSGRGASVTGALSVRDRTRPLSFDADVSVQGDRKIWLDAEVNIDRTHFGIPWNSMGMASRNNTLTIHAAFTRP
jgi:polyisoprenoid-binding protein YceI